MMPGQLDDVQKKKLQYRMVASTTRLLPHSCTGRRSSYQQRPQSIQTLARYLHCPCHRNSLPFWNCSMAIRTYNSKSLHHTTTTSRHRPDSLPNPRCNLLRSLLQLSKLTLVCSQSIKWTTVTTSFHREVPESNTSCTV